MDGGKEESARVAFFDGLRGLAILLVLFAHYGVGVAEGRPGVASFLIHGYSGVHLFLLLSGMCIGWAYVRADRIEPLALGKFARRRTTRILPAYYATLLISVVLGLIRGNLKSSDLPFQIATHLTLTHNLFPEAVLALNGPFWSLALEAQLYLCFPFLLAIARRFGFMRLLLVTFVAQSAYRLFILSLRLEDPRLDFVLPWALPGRVFEFSLGIVLAAHIRRGGRLEFLGAHAMVVPFLGFVVGFFLANLSAFRLGRSHPLTDILWTLSYASLILWTCSAPLGRRVFEWSPLAWLGLASYSIYLTHYLVIFGIARRLVAGSASDLGVLFWGAVSVMVTIFVCAPLYFAVERPALGYFRNRPRTGKILPAQQ